MLHSRACRRALGCALLVPLVFAANGCESAYPLPPTACDDYCHAVSRGCDDDSPAGCVRDCELLTPVAERAACAEQWQARSQCLLALDATAFRCTDDRTLVPAACFEERRALSDCVAPGSGSCFDECVRQAQTCGGDLSECEAGCRGSEPACRSAASDYYGCLQDFPVECRAWLEPDPREPQDIPCYDQALILLACLPKSD